MWWLTLTPFKLQKGALQAKLALKIIAEDKRASRISEGCLCWR
jgi:hypothetical protein